MYHLSVVERMDEEYGGTRYRTRCETCPWSAMTATEEAGYLFAERHTDLMTDRARAQALLAQHLPMQVPA